MLVTNLYTRISMQIDKHKTLKSRNAECTLCAIQMKASAGGENGGNLRSRLVQKVAEGKPSYESSWKAKVNIYTKQKQKRG